MDDPLYNPLYKQATDLQYKFHDYIGGVDHPTVHVLRNEIHELVNDIAMKKNPHALEDRLKGIQRQIEQTQRQNPDAINYAHTDYLHHNYQQMRQSLHKFNNY